MIVNVSSQRMATLNMLKSLSDSMEEDQVDHLDISSNSLVSLTAEISTFRHITYLNASNNQLNMIDVSIKQLQKLKVLDLRNNQLEESSIPYEFSELLSLEELNLSGNNFSEIPLPILKLANLCSLYFGANKINKLSNEIDRLTSLRICYLGGNLLEQIPSEIGNLTNLEVLSLSGNKIAHLPQSLGKLTRLRSLMLNDNSLQCLPFDVTRLRLEELSLRNNPLLVKFISDYQHDVPCLQELAARSIKAANLEYRTNLPDCLVSFLDSSKHCVNPRCQGVYFCSKVSNVKFVDICGKYQVPMLQYLCSPRCTRSRPNSPARQLSHSKPENVNEEKLKRVLLG